VLVGGVAAAAITVAIAGSPVLALVRGHGTSGAGSLTSLVRPDAPGVQGHGAADSSKAAGPNGTGQGGSQKTTCPTGGVPAPGSTVNGGLVVDGNCTITHVTVNGGVLIEGTGHLTLYRSTVNGGTHAQPRGEFDSNFPAVAGGANTLNGGIRAEHPIDMDIWGGTVRGRVLFTGQTAPAPNVLDRLTVCGVHLQGDLTLEHLAAAPNGANIGDPLEGDDFASGCQGNTISGSVQVRDNPASRIELEANSIGGSLEIFNSEPSVTANTIGGSLLCHEQAKLHHWDSDDSNTNTVHGTSRCS
jgi:hypothetical protein